MSEFLTPAELAPAEKEEITQEVEYALAVLRDMKNGKGANVSASTDVSELSSLLPMTDVNPKDFGLTTDELPDLINRYHNAIKDAP